jgi:hypothetical protein
MIASECAKNVEFEGPRRFIDYIANAGEAHWCKAITLLMEIMAFRLLGSATRPAQL